MVVGECVAHPHHECVMPSVFSVRVIGRLYHNDHIGFHALSVLVDMGRGVDFGGVGAFRW